MLMTTTGAPMEIIPLGRTSLPEDIIEEYLGSLKEVYTAEVRYHRAFRERTRLMYMTVL